MRIISQYAKVRMVSRAICKSVDVNYKMTGQGFGVETKRRSRNIEKRGDRRGCSNAKHSSGGAVYI